MSVMQTWTMTGAGGFTLAAIGDGVFSPASVLTTGAIGFSSQRLLNDGSRRALRIEDIYINSDVAHNLNLFYRPLHLSLLSDQ